LKKEKQIPEYLSKKETEWEGMKGSIYKLRLKNEKLKMSLSKMERNVSISTPNSSATKPHRSEASGASATKP
jgi:hypothetical protein